MDFDNHFSTQLHHFVNKKIVEDFWCLIFKKEKKLNFFLSFAEKDRRQIAVW